MPLPAELMTKRLERFVIYKIDRLRQVSRVLEPLAELDPIAEFHDHPVLAAPSEGAPRPEDAPLSDDERKKFGEERENPTLRYRAEYLGV